MTARGPCFALVAAGLLAAVALAPRIGSASERLGESPHGRSDRCLSCHVATEVGSPGAPLPVIATCRGCHPDAEMHPVGMRPEHVAVAVGWPLADGVVTCATCHAEPGCDASRETGAPWLRGGTPPRRADFCFRCHVPQEMARKSPHLPAGEADPSRAGCPACHRVLPPEGAGVADAGLLLPEGEACQTCHPGPAHAGAAEHVGKVQDRGALSKDAARALPLGPGDVIGCWTCHGMHAPPRPLAQPSPLADLLSGGAPRDGLEALLSLPLDDGSLCMACHGDGP